jgi:hypothetical protein
MPRLPKDYSKGLIYKLCCKDTSIKEIYVGSTTNFTQRKKTHKSCCNKETSRGYNYPVYKFIRENGGWDNWDMVLIEFYPCETELELGRRENYFMIELQSSLNKNSPNIYETHQEARHGYYENNKDYHNKKNKERYEANKEREREKGRKRYEANKDYHKKMGREWRELNKEKSKEYFKKYREENREQLLEKHNRKITCVCGCIVGYGGKARHEKSKKHLSMLQKQNPSGQDNLGNFVETCV